MAEFFFIEDGQTKTAVISAKRGLHPEVRFTYRPALADERYQVVQASYVDGKDRCLHMARLIKRHLESWNCTLASGEKAPLSEDLIRRLQPLLLSRMVDVVLGFEPSDEAEDVKN